MRLINLTGIVDMRKNTLQLASLATALVAAWLLAIPAMAEDAPPASKEKLPPAGDVQELSFLPPAIDLTNPYDYRQLLVTGKLATGETVDLTRAAKIATSPLVTVSEHGMIRPQANGQGTLQVAFGKLTGSVPLKVSGQDTPFEVSFVRDVNPTLSKLGCNAGTCHGAAQGKNGFKLSLRGYDPEFDHLALTDDLAARRVNRASPDQSLMLLKPAGGVPHVGGVLMQPEDRSYRLLRQWIADGMDLNLEEPRVTKIELLPRNPQLQLRGMKQQMVVLATYSDGTVRDVTGEAFVETNLAEIVECDSQGLATAVRRGEAALLARYEGAYDATTIVVMGDRTGYAWQDVPENNYIDQLVYQKLQRAKILPSELCSDADFIRRVYLDLTGLPPEPAEVRKFLEDDRPTRIKRDEMVDQLVGSPQFVEYWTNKWADLLQVNRKFLGEVGAWTFRNWIRQCVATNMPYDEFAYKILSASGSNLENPPASYYKVLRAPEDVMENTTQLFLAIRFNCNKCHDHPFERWTQDQYYHLAAYFAQVERKADPRYKDEQIGKTAVEKGQPLVEVIYDKGAGEVTHARTNKVADPAFPYEHAGELPDEASRREQIARWITSPENPYFAKSFVNRIWSYLLGVGLIEPADDIRAGNPPTNPVLLERLTTEFIEGGFDVQQMMRTICKSRTYQHSLATNQWNEDDEINFSHALARRLPAETLYDAVHQATGSQSNLPGLPSGFRAVQMPDSSVKLPDGFFNLFGKPARESACECERSSGMMLGPVLNLINGPTIAEAIADPNNRITQLVANTPDDERLIEELFVSVLCRRPTPEETKTCIAALHGFDEEHQAIVNVLRAYEQKEQPQRLKAWLSEQGGTTSWSPVEVVQAESAMGAILKTQQDGSILAEGKNPTTDVYTLKIRSPLEKITGLRLEVLSDASLPAKGAGRAMNGNFVLNKFEVVALRGDQKDRVPLQNAQADFSQQGFDPRQLTDTLSNARRGWAISPELGKDHSVLFETVNDVELKNDTLLEITLPQGFGNHHTIGRFRVSVTDSARPFAAEGESLPVEIREIVAVPADKRTKEQQAKLVEHFRTIDSKWQQLNATVAAHAQESGQARLRGAQDLVWALINSPAFLFNR